MDPDTKHRALITEVIRRNQKNLGQTLLLALSASRSASPWMSWAKCCRLLEGLHLQGDANPLQLLPSVGRAVLEAREVFILSFAIGDRPGKMSDRTGDFGHFCAQGELIFLPRWRLWERGESFPRQAAKWDHPSKILFG